MDHQDMTGIAAAAAALVLALGGWTLSPPPPMQDVAGLEQASRQALEANAVGQPLHWQDEDGDTVATIVPASAYREFDGNWCRPYAVMLAYEGKRTADSRHVACRDRDGRWSQLTRPAKGRTVATEPVTQLAGTLVR